MDFRILGPVEVGDDGHTVELGGARQRTLLAILLVHRNEVVPADRLLEDLYGADQPATAAKSLQAHVSRLRKALDADRVRTRGSGYVLVARPEEVDADRFAQLLDAGTAALAADDPAGARRALELAVSLWRGTPLDDVAYEEFARGEVARLEELRAVCVEALCDAKLALGQHAELVGELEALVAGEPHRERLRAAQMLALYRSGRQADALAAYREARTALDELGLEPGRALQELELSILRQDPELDSDDGVERGGTKRDAAPPEPPRAAREARKVVTAVVVGLETGSERADGLDPETLHRATTRAFEAVRVAVERHGGSLESIAGDAVTAVFGLPALHEDDALRGLRAADEARRRLRGLGEELAQELAVRLDARIGVATGEVLAGQATPTGLRATGTPLVAASRLARVAASGDVLFDEATLSLARDAVDSRPADAESQPAFRLLGVRPDPGGAARRFVSPMVGRERERRRLVDSFEQATADRTCQLFTILGTAGVGKSRLVREFLETVGDRATVAEGRCLPYGEGITFWPILEVVKSLAEHGDADVQHLVGAIGTGEEFPAVDESARAVQALFETLATRHPLVVVFDDIHWGEPTFLDLVEHVADASRVAPLLLVCVARPELLDARPGWGGGKPNATSALLEPLSEAECARLIENLVGAADVADEVRSRIAEAAEGNPLFVEEMLSMLVDDGSLVRENGGWRATRDLARVPVPPTIQALLGARLDQLEPAERATIEAAAVEGKVFHEGSVESLSGEGRTAAASLEALVRKELVRPEPPVFADERGFRFRHLLIRDAAYDAIPKHARAALHERHVEWLEAKAGEASVEFDEIIGYHLEQAYQYRVALGAVDEDSREIGRRAAVRLGTAGRRAFLRSDATAGVKLVSHAVALLPPSDPLRVELVPNVRVVQGMTDLSWADRALTEAVEAAATAGDRRLGAHALVQRGFLRLFTGSDVSARELIDLSNRAIAVFEETDDELGLARAWRLVAQAHYLDRRVESSAAASERALEHVGLATDPFEEREIVEWLVIALLLGPAHSRVALRRCEELLAQTADRPLLQAEVLGALAPLLAMQRRASEADDALARGREIMEAAGEWIWIVSFWRSMVYLWRNDPVAAERELRPGYETLKRIGERSHFTSLAHGLADALYMQGRYDEAERLTHDCEDACRPNDVHSHILWRSIRAKVLGRRGELERAEQLAREAVELAEEGDFLPAHAGAVEDLAKVHFMARRKVEARATLEEAIGLYESKGNLLAVDRLRAL